MCARTLSQTFAAVCNHINSIICCRLWVFGSHGYSIVRKYDRKSIFAMRCIRVMGYHSVNTRVKGLSPFSTRAKAMILVAQSSDDSDAWGYNICINSFKDRPLRRCACRNRICVIWYRKYIFSLQGKQTFNQKIWYIFNY